FISFSKEYRNPVKLNDLIDEYSSKASKQKQAETLLKILATGNFENKFDQFVAKKELENNGVSASVISTLSKNGIIEIQKLEVDRLNFFSKKEEIKELS